MLNYETFVRRETNLIKKYIYIVLHVLFVIKIKLLYFLLMMIFTKSTAKRTLQPDESPRYLM